jgi:hypothetical protein
MAEFSGTVLYVVGANLSSSASYSPAQLPSTGDAVIVDGDLFASAITTSFAANLDLFLFEIRDNYDAAIGSLGNPIVCSADTLKYMGGGTMYFKYDGSGDLYPTCQVIVDSNNQTNAMIIDSDGNNNMLTRVHVRKGYVTIAATAGDILDVQLSYRNNPDRDAILVIPASSFQIDTLTQSGGQLDCERDVTTGVQMAGTWEQSISGIRKLFQAAGLCVYNYDTLAEAHVNGTLDFNQSRERKTAAVYKFPKGNVKYNDLFHEISFLEMGATNR